MLRSLVLNKQNAPWDVIARLEADNSRLAKEQIIRAEAEAGNTEFFRGSRAALDSMITYGVKQVEPKTGDGKGLQAETFWRIAQELAERKLTGNQALFTINTLRAQATEAEWNLWYRRILIKDLRCGVSEKTVNSVVKNINEAYTVPVFTCQLAHDGANHESKITGEKLIEVKLDGVRVVAIVYPSGVVNLFSRNGKELTNFPHIERQLSKHAVLFAEPTVLDGEIMSASFQDLMKQVHRKDNVQADDAVLHLFDMLTLREFQAGQGEHRQIDRSYTLKAWHSHIADHMPNVTTVGYELVDLRETAGQARFAEINNLAIRRGYEGIMIKDPAAVYETKRTTAWLKQKPFIEVSLKVVGLEEGTGKNAGRLGALICEGEDDGKIIRTNVGSGLSDSIREEIWSSQQEIIGQVVEIRADATTKNQDSEDVYSLRFPRFLRFRGFSAGEKM
jgi:DNA ligase-1